MHNRHRTKTIWSILTLFWVFFASIQQFTAASALVFLQKDSIPEEMINQEDYLEISPLLGLAESDEIIQSYKTMMENYGGIPVTSSSFDETYFAIQTLQTLRQLDINASTSTVSYILSQYDENLGGFFNLDGTNSTTLESNYYGIQSLITLNEIVPSDIILSLKDYLLGINFNHSYFLDYNQTNDGILKNTFYGIKLIDLLNLNRTDFINEMDTMEMVLSQYHRNLTHENYGFFGDLYETRFEQSYWALKVIELIGDIFDDYSYLSDFKIYLNNGNASGVNINNTTPLELKQEDLDLLKIQSQNHNNIELFIDIPLDYIVDSDGEENFEFLFKLNSSEDIDGESYVRLLNATSSTWIDISNPNVFSAFNSPIPKLAQVFTGDIPYEDIIIDDDLYTEEPYNDYCRIHVNMTHSTPFNISWDLFKYQYKMVNKSETLRLIDKEFSTAFDFVSLETNFYGYEIYYLLDALFPTEKRNAFIEVVRSFKELENGYKLQNTDQFSVRQASYYAATILDDMDATDVEEREETANNVLNWQFLDGGFGGMQDLSLKSTMDCLEFFEILEIPLENYTDPVLTYIEACLPAGGNFFFDGYLESSSIQDTYYAIKIIDFLDLSIEGYDISLTVAEIIDSQVITGFFVNWFNLGDVYFALAILHEKNAVEDLPYSEELAQKISDFQLYYGGFKLKEFDHEANLEGSCYAILIAQYLGYSGIIRYTEIEKDPGVLDFFNNRQNPTHGYFYDDNSEYLENSTVEFSYDINYLISRTFENFAYSNYLNISGLIHYFKSTIDDYVSLNWSETVQTGDFYTHILQFMEAYVGSTSLITGSINISVLIERETVFPGEQPNILIIVQNQNQQFMEGCEVNLIQEESKFRFNDLQNGLYTNTLFPYNTSQHAMIEVQVIHPDLVEYRMEYDLMICDPIDLRELGKAELNTVVFQDQYQFEVTLRNKSNKAILPHATIDLIFPNETITCVFNDDTEKYEAFIDLESWAIVNQEFTLELSGDLIRPERLSCRLVGAPKGLSYASSGGALGVVVLAIGIPTILKIVKKKKGGATA